MEVLANGSHFHLPVEDALPQVLAAARAVLQRVLDLTDAKIRKMLRLSRETLFSEDWQATNADGGEALTQAIGRLVWDAVWEGLIVPSAPDPRGVNLIVFPGNLVPPESYFLILNREELPPHPAI